MDKLPCRMDPDFLLLTACFAQLTGSFEEAKQYLRSLFGVSPGDDTIRKAATFVGRLVLENDLKAAAQAADLRGEDGGRPAPMREGILYLRILHFPVSLTWGAGEEKFDPEWRKDQKARDTSLKAHETKLGIVWTLKSGQKGSERVSGKMPQKEYIVSFGSEKQFQDQLYECALRFGYGSFPVTVVLSDGADWVNRLANEVFPEAVILLAWGNLKEEVKRYAGRRFAGEPSRAEQWAERILDLLWNGQSAQVLQELNTMQEVREGRLYRYLLSNQEFLDYPGCRQMGYEVGDDSVGQEAKKIQFRFRNRSMFWSVEGAQALATLRAKWESGLWHEAVEEAVYRYFRP